MSVTSITTKLQDAIVKAVKFMETSQWPGGFWIDFELYVGMSNQWVTAYVAHCLARAAPHSTAIPPAMAYLQRTELPAGGWGFNRHVPPDGDSTANVVYLLARYGGEMIDPPALQRSARILASFQSKGDGGFVTYKARQVGPQEEKPAFMYPGSGWTISHLSVAALAAVALLAVDASLSGDAFLPQRQRAAQFIRDRQVDAGYWEDHWWHDRVYATYWGARFLATNAPGVLQADQERVRQAQEWLAQEVQAGGAWGDGKGGPAAAFYTSLAVSTLLLEADCDAVSSRPRHFERLIRRGLEWLLETQSPDGSWPSIPMLLTPVPEVLVPWQSQHPTSQQATPDQNRLFTSATSLVALARGREWLALL